MNRATSRDGAGPEPGWVAEVLRYWLEDLTEKQWFDKRPEIDDQIRGRFLPLHERLCAVDAPVLQTPREFLAAIIVLDQFSRNLFRGSARAYEADGRARRLASTALRRGYDLEMTDQQKHFLYLPFQHSEDRQDQARSLALFEKLGNANWTDYARAHKSIIDRFGRFPHRNAILGRHSSPEEIALLSEPMGSF